MTSEPLASAPIYDPVPPRALTPSELAVLLEVADILIPDGSIGPRPSAQAQYPAWLDRALAARRDVFDDVVSTLEELARCPRDGLADELRRISEASADSFEALSSVLAAAYLLIPEVRSEIGYPGQANRPPRFDEAVEQVMSGILDPVIDRGLVYRAADDSATPMRGDG